MSHHLQHISVRVGLSEYGDALIYGTKEAYGLVPAMYLKQLLFAWHEPSFYGTELQMEQTPEVELIVLPSEQVIPFFAEAELLHHVRWSWEEEAATLRQLAPALLACLNDKKYLPSLAAYRRGRLQWKWDADQLLRAVPRAQRQALQHALKNDVSPELLAGLQAAFSASVSERYYNSEAENADLRREFPALFDRNNSTAGLDESTWLITIGWKSDTAPFRPASSYWSRRIQIVVGGCGWCYRISRMRHIWCPYNYDWMEQRVAIGQPAGKRLFRIAPRTGVSSYVQCCRFSNSAPMMI